MARTSLKAHSSICFANRKEPFLLILDRSENFGSGYAIRSVLSGKLFQHKESGIILPVGQYWTVIPSSFNFIFEIREEKLIAMRSAKLQK